VLCGKIWITWNSISGIVNGPKFLGQTLNMSAFRNMPSAESLFDRRLLPLQSIIKRFAGMQCEDPRDKVYGLLGLVEEQKRPEVDYSKTLYQIYSDTVSSIYQHQRRPITFNGSLLKCDLIWCTKFARDLGFSQETIDVLAQLFRDIGVDAQVRSADQQECSYTLMIEFQPATPSVGTPDRWWREMNGQPRYYVCNPRD
jgi:hypothetical protein